MTFRIHVAAIVCLAFASSNFLSPAIAKEPLNAELLAHGVRQVENMIEDRPSMGAYPTENGFKLVRPTDPFYKWAVRKFAGEDTESPVFWDASDPVTEAEHSPPLDDNVGLIRVSRKINSDDSGAWKGKEKTFEVLWSQAIFELNNIGGFAVFLGLHDRALKGRIEREAYIMGSAKNEQLAILKTNEFFKETWVPWAIEMRLKPSTQRFLVAWSERPTTFDEWISNYTDRKKYPWVPFGDYFDEAEQYRVEFGEATVNRVPPIEFWKGLQDVLRDANAPRRE